MAITINLLQENQPLSTRIYSITVDNNTVLTTVTTNHYVADTWVSETTARYSHIYIGNRLIIGVAIQYAPTGRNSVATLQLSTGTECLIFHLCHSHAPFTPITLRRFLFDSHVNFVCLEDLVGVRLGLTPQGLAFRRHMPQNLRRHVRGWNGENVEYYSVPRIAREYLGVFIDETDMGSTSSNWEVDHLTLAQIGHATLAASVPSWIAFNLQRLWDLGYR